MIKQSYSWSKPDDKPNLIGIKKVDWSVFEYGSTIPSEFHADFDEANGGYHLAKGDKHEIKLIFDDRAFDALLVNVDRKNIGDTYQIRYDNNKELKTFLKEMLNSSYRYLLEVRSVNENTKKVAHVPDEISEFMEFYQTGTPFIYRVVLKVYQPSNTTFPHFWWVNQGKTHEVEKSSGILWAPKVSKSGVAFAHHTDLTKAKPGDLVFVYAVGQIRAIAKVDESALEKPKPKEIASDAWQQDGYLLPVSYYELKSPITKDEIPLEWRITEDGPFDRNGNVKQGYFFSVSDDFVQKLYHKFKERFPEGVAYNSFRPRSEAILETKDFHDGKSTHEKLAEPFNSIFIEYGKAEQCFDLMRETAKRLGIRSESDPRLSVTYRKDMRSIHFNFCSWLILGFKKLRDGQVGVQLPLLIEETGNIKGMIEEDYIYQQKINEKPVRLYTVSIEAYQDIDSGVQEAYLRTIDFVKTRFANYSKTPYRRNHLDILGAAIFDLAAREKLLKNGIDPDILKSESIEPSNYFTTFDSDQALIDHIHSYISSKGFYYSKENVINLFLALKTKPFVILSGISGTGKTQIVRYFAESLGATKENGRFTMIPVRPDWSDGSDLLGYTNLKGKFQPGPLTRVLREASRPENRNKPFFVLLDEMNLARVEYYFSDFLSIMESRDWKGDRIVTDSIELDKGLEERVTMPDNVYIIGTVNMDETTHPFSQKVLDRANTIEFNEVKLDHFEFLEEEKQFPRPALVSNAVLRGEYIRLKDAYREAKDLIYRITGKLVEVNAILNEINASFGYRVRDEICFYMIHNEKAGLLTEDVAFDLQLCQKILPRLSGSDERTYRVLKQLYRFCTNRIIEEDRIDNLKEDLNHAPYPKSAAKLADMIWRLQNDGFTSFWF